MPRKGKHPPALSKTTQLTMAEAIVTSEKVGVPVAAHEYGIPERTIHRYRARLRDGQCQALAVIVSQVREARATQQKDLLGQVYEAALKRLLQLTPNANHLQVLNTVEKIGELKIASEHYGSNSTGSGTGPDQEVRPTPGAVQVNILNQPR